MIKKIDIAGLQLDNYTVREMIMRVDRRISEKILTTIEEVNMDTLALAESDEEVKQSLEACDYTVIADEGILRAVSADTLQRRHEIEDHDFFYEFFKRLERNDKKIFVIATGRGCLQGVLHHKYSRYLLLSFRHACSCAYPVPRQNGRRSHARYRRNDGKIRRGRPESHLPARCRDNAGSCADSGSYCARR